MTKAIACNSNLFGRIFDTNTQTWVYPDGSGNVYPEEMRQDLISALNHSRSNGLTYLSCLFEWKSRLEIYDATDINVGTISNRRTRYFNPL